MNKERLHNNLISCISMILASCAVFFILIMMSIFSDGDFPPPVECDDPNAVTFDDYDFSFAVINKDDIDSADGELKIAEIKGNRLLEFVDSGTNYADNTVQKIKFDFSKILSSENLAKVCSIEMDVYADATATELVTENGKNVKAPGWIGGGAGANVEGDKWYKFGDWSGGEYNFSMSGNIHLEFKFLLAENGKHWSGNMDEATFMIMRWGAQNEGNFYIDNIIFYDKDKNSLPIEKNLKNTGQI